LTGYKGYNGKKNVRNLTRFVSLSSPRRREPGREASGYRGKIPSAFDVGCSMLVPDVPGPKTLDTHVIKAPGKRRPQGK